MGHSWWNLIYMKSFDLKECLQKQSRMSLENFILKLIMFDLIYSESK